MLKWTLFALTAVASCAFADQAAAPSTDACSTLSADEQKFASGLSMDNQKMFCSKFSAAQRASCMQMTTTPGASGAMMTGDQAVMQVSKDSNMMQSAPAKGGCPVK